MLPGFNLKRKIFLVIFTEIHSLCPNRNPFAGVIFETHTPLVISPDALLGAEDGAIIQFGTVDAVGAGMFDFLSKQHCVRLFSHNYILYNSYCENATGFSIFRRITAERTVDRNTMPTR